VFRHRSRLVLIVVAALSLVTMVVLAGDPVVASPLVMRAASPPRHLTANVSGTFVGQPLVITDVVPTSGPNVYAFDVTGGDQWSGDLTGTTAYHGNGTIDLSTNETRMELHETFTGSVAGFGAGQLHFVEYLHSGPGNLGEVDCLVLSGDGALGRVRGGLDFQATSVVDPDPTGNGTSYGGYTGFLFK
jgi:hypothetical protein